MGYKKQKQEEELKGSGNKLLEKAQILAYWAADQLLDHIWLVEIFQLLSGDTIEKRTKKTKFLL